MPYVKGTFTSTALAGFYFGSRAVLPSAWESHSRLSIVFIAALLKLPVAAWHPLGARIGNACSRRRSKKIPVRRTTLSEQSFFPALHAGGLETSTPGTARWLAGFAQLLYKSPSCSEQLPEDQRSEHGLLLRAVSENPSDIRAKKRLRTLMRSGFDYVLHELPSGVLYGQNGATIAQCDELLAELSDYERLTQEVGYEGADPELVRDLAQFSPFTAYQTLSYRMWWLRQVTEQYLSGHEQSDALIGYDYNVFK